MSRSRTSGSAPDFLNHRRRSVRYSDVRSADKMSSPDPLNDSDGPTILEPILSSAGRRITRSQRGQRFTDMPSSGERHRLPRKSLVHNSPHDILPTVETSEDELADTQRLLFPVSSSPYHSSRKRPRATTTVVRLNDSMAEDVSDIENRTSIPSQPKTKLRTSNGTPIPPAGTKRRAGTPVRRSPRRRVEEVARELEGEAQSEMNIPETPSPKRRTKPSSSGSQGTRSNLVPDDAAQASPTPRRSSRSRKQLGEPSSELGTISNQDLSSALRGGRRRRQTLMPQELEELADEVAGSDAPGIDDASEDEIEALTLPDDIEPSHEAEAPHADSDIWLGMGNDATPKASERNRQTASQTPTRRSAASRSPSLGTQNAADPFSEADYGYFPPAHSDVSSADEEPTPTRPAEMDTIAQGEDFSMIFMDSIPSLHDSSHHAGKYSDIGEETSIIINNTLESIRKGTNQEVETIEEEQEQEQDRHEYILNDPADDEEADDDQAGAEAEEEEDGDDGDVVAEMNPLEREIPASPTPPPRAQKLPSRSPQQSARTARGSSQTRKSPSRSPAKPLLVPPPRDARKTATPSPLRHKVLRNQTIDVVSTHEHTDSGSQSAPLGAEESLFVQDREPEQLSYEDSFSEIPQDVLDAATPQKETRTFTDVYESDEQAAEDDNEVEQDYDEVNQEPLEPYNPGFQQTVEVEEDVDEDVEMGDAKGEDYQLDEDQDQDQDAAEFEVEEQVVDDAEFDDEPEAQPQIVEDDEVEDDEVENDEVEEAADESPEAESDMEAEAFDPQDDNVEEEAAIGESEAKGDAEAELVDEQHEDAAPDAFGYLADADEAPAQEVRAGELVEEPEDIAVEAMEEEASAEEEFEGNFDELPAEIELMGNNGIEYAHSPEHANQPVTLVLESEAREEVNLYDDDEASESADNAPVSYDDIARHPYIHPRSPTPDDEPLPLPIPAKSPASFRSHRRQQSITSPLPPQGQHTQPPQITIAQPSSTPIVKSQTSRSVSRSASSMEATPLNQMSSPVQDPQSVVHELHERNLRPLLSATVRAGRALQSVTSDPPSPDAGDRLLRSPFRRSGSKDSRHGSKERQAARTASRSPSRSLFNTSAPAPVDDEMQIDLNRVSPKSISSPVAPPPAEVAAPIRTTASPRFSQTSSVRQSPPSDAAMSWVAREGPISPKLRGDNSLRNAYGSPSQRKAPAAQPLPQVDSAADENEGVQAEQAPTQAQTQEENIIRDDETDIWEFEARRSTPPRQQFGSKTLTQSARKRGGIPSPWTRKTRQNLAGLGATVSSGVMGSQLTATTKAINPAMEPADGEEYSLLARRQAVEEAERGQSSAVKAGRFDLSSFFSSPAAIPGMLAEKFIPGMARPAPGGTMAQEEQPPMAQIQTTSMFPSVASQPRRTPARSRLDSESDTASTPRPRVQHPAQSSPELELRLELEPTPEPEREREPTPEPEVEPEPEPEPEPTPQPVLQPTPRARPQIVVQPRSTLKSQPRRPPRPSIRPAPRVAEPKSPAEQATTPVIAQKQNFTPRTTPRSTRQTDNSFFQGSSARAAAATPPRMQLSHDDIRRWQQEMSSASDESTDFVKPFLRPLPPKNASPKKSSLRSPLKPHTPGRVVEFTSSVLSPLEQAKARHERRMSNASTPQNHSLLSGPRVSSNVSDKENRESVASASGSAASSARSVAVPLSQTTWTRQHWLFLDWLIQTRRGAPFEEPYDRSADRYLGKVVRAQGMAMALERWHLDCVDAFTEEVGGWEVGYLIKRLFALLLGEERRTQSQTQELMFH
ncbi:hypothetical protein VHEMI03813 [[Torrubiella] hemipterigena]|uniref:Uncharacterized protein n=1 Tax=[Torrubiella] hemipterigena TaxID=1531966 RepID=A0A0A1SZI1_9HYPO|nr:hypothetical protein VHEMI03813 [[Torrubiella] hemipterigena]